MKLSIHTILIWILTLSLTGLPVMVQSQGIAGLKQVEKNILAATVDVQDSAAKVTDVQATGMTTETHCHSSSDVATEEKLATSSHDDCCCADCQCDNACQSTHNSGNTAVLQPDLMISFSMSSQLVIEFAISYLEYDSDVEKSPPIV